MSRRKVLELFEKNRSYMEERITSGIEQHRKGGATLLLKNELGEPVTNAKVFIKQKKHEFKYGANLFMLDEMETKEKNDRYKQYMASFGNMATLPFYWNTLEPEQGKTRYGKDSERIYRRPPIDLCMEFCEANGIEPREHALAYDFFFPEWLRGKSDYEVKQALSKRFREVAERYGDKITTIEVTNETFWGLEKAVTDFYNHNDFVEWCFKEAEKYFGANQLVINETQSNAWVDGFGRNRGKYYMQIERALSKGARIDAIGFQFHMFHKKEAEYERTRLYYDPLFLYQILDRYADFGLPLQITEVTIPAYFNDAEDEEIQAEIIKILYSIWFSHPNVEQIIYWNLVDGYAHVGNPNEVARSQGNMTEGENQFYGGLVRFDLTPKPAYHTVKNLFEKQWHTEETLNTDEGGSAFFRGFYGTYDVEIELNGKRIVKEIDLHKNGRSTFELVLPSNLK